MGRLVQIRDVPEPVHRTLKARAAQSGSSLSEYLRTELARLAALPTPDELRARIRSRSVVKVREQPEAIIRRAREAGR
jgi:plasmid stability protein